MTHKRSSPPRHIVRRLRVRRRRDGSVVVEIAGRRIDTGKAPYLPDDVLRGQADREDATSLVSADRLVTIRSRRTERESEIVQIAVAAFERLMGDDAALRSSVAAEMNAVAHRITIPCFSGSPDA